MMPAARAPWASSSPTDSIRLPSTCNPTWPTVSAMVQIQGFIEIEIAFREMVRGVFHKIARGIEAHAGFLDHEIEGKRILPVEIAVQKETRPAALDEQTPGVPGRPFTQARKYVQLKFERGGKD